MLWRLRQPERPTPSPPAADLDPLARRHNPPSLRTATRSPSCGTERRATTATSTSRWSAPPEARRLTTDPATDMWPAWSPDGRQIAFVRLSTGSATGTIHVISPLGGADRKLSDQPVTPVRSRGRRMVDGWRRGHHGGARFYGATCPQVSGSSTSRAARSDRSPLRPGRRATFNPLSRPTDAISPTRRAPASTRAMSTWWSWDRDRATRRKRPRLTQRVIWSQGLAWTRDGASVVYGDTLSGRLWRVSIRGTRHPRGSRSPVSATASAVSPRRLPSPRDRLAFVGPGTRPTIYRFEAGRPPQAVAASSLPYWDWNPHLSPDGSRLAFESNRGGGGDEVWLAASDGSSPVQLTHGPGLWQGSPRWSPDGRRIAFDSYGEDGQWDIWTIDADGGSVCRVTSDPADDNMPTWSQDGRFIYFSSDRSGTQTVWRVPAAGGREEEVARTGGGRSQEAPDGKALYFLRATLPSSPLLAVSLAGGPERTVVDCVPRDGFAIGMAGVYHVGCGGDARDVPLSLLDPATGRDQLLGMLESGAGGLTVSGDANTILYTRFVGEGSDLWLIENLH